MHEIMFYLSATKQAVETAPPENDITLSYLVVAIELPTGAIELQINSDKIMEKIDYILDNYDEETVEHKSATGVFIKNLLVV